MLKTENFENVMSTNVMSDLISMRIVKTSDPSKRKLLKETGLLTLYDALSSGITYGNSLIERQILA